MSFSSIGHILAEDGWGRLRPNQLAEYFNFIKACRAVARELAGDPLFAWEISAEKEIQLRPNPESSEDEEEWKQRTRRMLKITGGNLAAYAVTDADLEEKGRRIFVRRERQEDCQLELNGTDAEEITLEVQELPDKGTLIYLDIDSQALEAQLRALERLQKNPHPRHHRALLGLFDDRGLNENYWPDPIEDEEREIRWEMLNPAFPGAEAQMNFVQRALRTPDFVLLKGPPGAGKTTAIAELILQVAATKPDARMLLTASTHVAIDNVLAHLARYSDKVTCVRIASQHTVKNVTDPAVTEMLLPRIVNRERTRIAKQLAGDNSPSAMHFRATAEDPESIHVRELIITSSTLAAGTPRGILQHPFLRANGPGPQTYLLNPIPFDYIIVDEASKTSLLEFMVPAIYAKRWVIVGDDCQLPPYMGRTDVGAALRVLAPDCKDDIIEQVAGKLVRWRERLFQKLESGHEQITEHAAREGAEKLRKIFLPSIYGLLSTGHGLSSDSVLGCGLPEGALSSRSVSLDYQNRMHPEISEFPRKSFYSRHGEGSGGQTLLLDNPMLKDRPWPHTPKFAHRSVWWDVPAAKMGGDASGKDEDNPAEAYVVASEVIELLERSPKVSIAVICFHKKQRRAVIRAFEELSKESLRASGHKVEFLTVDSCQGREADVVLVSFSLAVASTFMRDPNRLNVAITRARHQLILVGNLEGMLRKKASWVGRDHLRELAEHHRDKRHTNHETLKLAKAWKPDRKDHRPYHAPHPRTPQHGKGKPWRQHTKPKPPNRNSPPWNGINFDGLDR